MVSSPPVSRWAAASETTAFTSHLGRAYDRPFSLANIYGALRMICYSAASALVLLLHFGLKSITCIKAVLS